MAKAKQRSLKEIKQLATEMFAFDSFEDHDKKDVMDVLKAASDEYHAGREFITDEQYDSLYRYTEMSFGIEETEEEAGVGSDVRGGKVPLPYPMGSLDQVYEGEVQNWLQSKGLGRDVMLILSHKLDGNSGLARFLGDGGKFTQSFSRGRSGLEGADSTRHLRRITSMPSHTVDKLDVRGEVILSRKSFEFLKTRVMSRSGKPYKNARNMVSGLMNAETNDPLVYQHLRFIAYDILNVDMSKQEQLEYLARLGFDTPKWSACSAKVLNDKFLTSKLEEARQTTEYEIDGIVLDVEDINLRRKLTPTRDTLNPAHAFKYKVADAANIAVTPCISVEYNPSKHGYLKPRVNIEPVELVGVTVRFATGFNARFIHDNKIGPGALIRITRSGDVIPFIVGVVQPAAEPQMPSVDWKWNDTEVDAVLSNPHDNEEVMIQQLVDFFTSIDAPNLKEGSIRAVFERESGFEDVVEALTHMIVSPRQMWTRAVGENGNKIFEGLRAKLENIPAYELLGATTFFGRGVGVRKWKKLIAALDIKNILDINKLTVAHIVSVQGFDEKTAKKIVNGMHTFFRFYGGVMRHVFPSFPEQVKGGDLAGKGFVFTEFRSEELEKVIEAQGGTIQSGVSKKTSYVVTTNPSGTTTKLKKARELSIPILDESDLREMLGE